MKKPMILKTAGVAMAGLFMIRKTNQRLTKPPLGPLWGQSPVALSGTTAMAHSAIAKAWLPEQHWADSWVVRWATKLTGQMPR